MKNSFGFVRLVSLVFAGWYCLLVPSTHAQTAPQIYADALQSYNAGDIAEAKRKLRITLEVDKNFRPASLLLNRIDLAQKDAKGISQGTAAPPVSVKTLEKIVFPVEFKDTTLETALEYIRQQVETISGGKTQLNFVLQLTPEQAHKKVSLQLNRAPVTEVLRYLGDLAGVGFQFQKYAVVVAPAGAGPSGADAGAVSSHP